MNNFDTWWEHCPKKVGKIACRKSYARQVRVVQRERPDDEPHAFLLAAIAAYGKSKLVADGYVTNPLTWLNQGRYYDEDVTPSAAPVERAKVTLMDSSVKEEMARAKSIRAARHANRCECGRELFQGKVTGQWQCTRRSCYVKSVAQIA